MFTIDLARELERTGVTVNSLHPASYMDTTMVRSAGVTSMSTVDEGAEAVIHLAVSPDTQKLTGEYFSGKQPSRAHAQAYDSEARRRLAELSLRLTGSA
jgi:NAD(P)-dependent dehydrogenase (short-subunit alcohol dehydrogenase family)